MQMNTNEGPMDGAKGGGVERGRWTGIGKGRVEAGK